MERPAILLDENLLWCCGLYVRELGNMIKAELVKLGLNGDAVLFVGQTSVSEKAARMLIPKRFQREMRALGEFVAQAARDCHEQSRPSPNPAASFKHCFDEKLARREGGGTISEPETRYDPTVKVGVGAQPSFRIPPQGTRDVDIMVWATENAILIVSQDRGGDLEPSEASTRILVRPPQCACGDPEARKKYAEAVAATVLRRMRQVKGLLGGI